MASVLRSGKKALISIIDRVARREASPDPPLALDGEVCNARNACNVCNAGNASGSHLLLALDDEASALEEMIAARHTLRVEQLAERNGRLLNAFLRRDQILAGRGWG